MNESNTAPLDSNGRPGRWERLRDTCGPLIDEWIESRARMSQLNAEHGIGFNPLDTLRLKETQHSRLLGMLLNPNGEHGQENLFLAAFLDHLDVPSPREGRWQVTVEWGRVDLMIWRENPACVVLIENKACNAVDQRSQIYRYWHEQVFQWEPDWDYSSDAVKRAFQIIYLTPDSGKMPELQCVRRPPELASENHFEVVPREPRQMTFKELTALWNREARPRIPESNQRLLWLLDCYSLLWTQ